MKALRILASGLGLFVLAALAYSDCAFAASESVVSGELVVTNAAANHFRIVGHSGSYTAPAGTPLTSLDGHTVRVDLSSNGRVLQITDTPVPINPITHGWSTARGALVVTDAASGHFSFAGDDRTYVAPPGVDIASYAGRMVEITMDENGHVTDFHAIGAPPEGSYLAPPAVTSCTYRGQAYSAGAAVCQSGTQYRCDGSRWRNLGASCQTSEGSAAGAPPRAPRECVVGGATVANGSGICRDGSVLRCDDGAWIGVHTACR